MKFTGERYIPELEDPEISYEHWHRYLFAKQFVSGKVVLDVACGEGYGSYFLATTAKKVIGVDVSQETIKYASSKYLRDNLEFRTGLASNIRIENAIFDVIVSFETIEHITEADQFAFLAEVKRLLKSNGVFLVSTPNKLIYSDLHNYKNEFHLKEFTIPEFQEFLNVRFKYVDLLGQKIEMGSYMTGLDNKHRSLTEYRLNFSEKGFRPTDEPRDILYVVAVCSDKPLAKVSASFALDISWRMISIRDRQIGELTAQVAEKEQSVQALSAQVAEKEKSVKALSAQVAEKEKSVKALSAQVAEKEQSVQALSAQVAEKEKSVKALTWQYHEITISKAWRVAIMLRHIRVFMLPPGSLRIRLARKMRPFLLSPFTIPQINKRNQDLTLIRNSGLFDTDWYLAKNPDLAQAGVDPLLHYLRYGGFEGRDPSQFFSSKWYIESNQDVKNSGMNPLIHYLRYGKKEGRLPRPNVKGKLDLQTGKSIGILCTPHTIYIAKAISAALKRISINSHIFQEIPANGYADIPYFVICPQWFSTLPETYVAFQIEQSVSSRWFTNKYHLILENAFATLDYSIRNIDFLKSRGLSLKQIYYVPIDYIANYSGEPDFDKEDYDVVFYGDVNNERRQKFLVELQKHFRVKTINNLFGDLLYKEVARARVVVNIHYYEDALLETTRIWECISLNKLVISERSTDMDENTDLHQLVDFVDINDVLGMVERIQYWLNNEELRRKRISENCVQLRQRFNRFDYFFYRFLLATDNITFIEFWSLIGHKANLPSDTICLTLPEYSERAQDFQKSDPIGFSFFYGLRHHTKSWIGCAMSYKFMIMLARQQTLPQITICEDDVEFQSDFSLQFNNIKAHLNDQNLDWNIFSGFMADVNKDTCILDIYMEKDQEFVVIDRFISTVFNVYHQSIYDLIAMWDETNLDVSNTIDRYLETYKGLRILTTIPFLVGHKKNAESIIWGFQNTQYLDLINASNQLLRKKIQEYKKIMASPKVKN
jgi:ubiquinone/menaquinone biosynthesis C-methylase UbiE/uncharacterized coiled-coil protein SlyX